jgi:hypothetical protein
MRKRKHLFWLTVSLAANGCGSEQSIRSQDPVATTESELATGTIDLIATGSLSGAVSDRSTDTAGALENGVAGNLLGGIGSGLAYAGGQKFLALPDRGPNAVSYNAAVDDTTSYIARFQSVRMNLKKSTDGSALPFSLTPELKKTTLLSERQSLVYGTGSAVDLESGAPALNDKNHHYFTGRSDNFDATQASNDSSDARLDPEGIRVSNDGQTVFVSDEYGPYFYAFDRQSGQRTRTFALPSDFAVTQPNAQGDTEISDNSAGRVANKGTEGLAITPDGLSLVGAMQSPLLQDGGTNASVIRIVKIAIDSGAIQQFAYRLTNIGSATKPKYPTVSEILAIDDHEFLVDERDGKGLGDDSAAAYKKLYRIDLANARDVTALSGEANLLAAVVNKSEFLDIVSVLNAHGIASTEIPAKLEGTAFGPDVHMGHSTLHTLFVSNDNDFFGSITDTNHPAGIDNPNQFFVFGFAASQVASFSAQPLVDDDADDSDNSVE